MSAYDSKVTGHLTITPPLNWGQIKGSRFFVEDSHQSDPDVILRVLRKDEETETGVNTVFYAERVVPYTEAPYNTATILEDVEELATTFKGQEIRGEFIVVGEDAGDVRRIVVDDKGVREEKARFLWPTGEEVVLP